MPVPDASAKSGPIYILVIFVYKLLDGYLSAGIDANSVLPKGPVPGPQCRVLQLDAANSRNHGHVNRTIERIRGETTRINCGDFRFQKLFTCTQFRFVNTPIVCDSSSYALRDSDPVIRKFEKDSKARFLTIQLRNCMVRSPLF